MSIDAEDKDSKPASWPLLFTYKSRVFGKGYIAEIEMCGRLLAELEVEGVWLYGVNPGAMAVGAPNLSLANAELRKSLAAVFADIAEESDSFEQFHDNVGRFFNETDKASISEWECGVARLKAQTVIEAPGGLPIKDSVKTRVFIRVDKQSTDTLTPQDNSAETEQTSPTLSAAA